MPRRSLFDRRWLSMVSFSPAASINNFNRAKQEKLRQSGQPLCLAYMLSMQDGLRSGQFRNSRSFAGLDIYALT
jgi:hypothetical protein